MPVLSTIRNSIFSNPVRIEISESDTNKISVTVQTKRLRIQSVTKEDLPDYVALHSDPMVMEKYATGNTKDADYVEKRITTWTTRWNERDPFSGLCVRDKKTNEFIGHIVLGHGDRPGQSEIAFLFHKKFWNQGFGKEAVTAIIQDYAPELIRRGYLLEGKPLDEIVATSRQDNTAGVKILTQLMGEAVKQEEKFGSLRNHYSLKMRNIEVDNANSHHLSNVFVRIREYFRAA